MAFAAAIVARNLGLSCLSLNPFLGTGLGSMAEFATIVAFRNTSVDDHTGVVQAGQNLSFAIRPGVNLAGSLWLVREPDRDAVLFVNLALEIHVRESINEISLSANEPNLDVFSHQTLLNLAVSDLSSKSFDVLLNGFLGIVHVPFTSRLLELVPGSIRSDIGDVVTIHFASILTVVSEVAWCCSSACTIFHINSMTYLLRHSWSRAWEAPQGSPSSYGPPSCSNGRPVLRPWGNRLVGAWGPIYERLAWRGRDIGLPFFTATEALVIT
jgi:hypothetical protein